MSELSELLHTAELAAAELCKRSRGNAVYGYRWYYDLSVWMRSLTWLRMQ